MPDSGPAPTGENNGANQPPEPSGTEEVLLRRYYELANKRKHEVANKRQREEERRKTLMVGKPIFFAAFGVNPFEDDSCIASVRFPFRISKYQCPVCKGDSTSADFAYPHLDPSEILDRDELRTIEGKSWTIFEYAPDQDAVIKCVKRLSGRWLVPVTSSTSLGPGRLTLGRGVKYDFKRLIFSSALFVRKNAVELLRREGFDLDFVEVEHRGKSAAEANYVQLVIPVTAHEAMPEGAFYCEVCKRVGGDKGKEWPKILFDSPGLHQYPVFMTAECANVMLAPQFVDAANRLGLTGLVENKTVFPWPVMPDPVASRVPLQWPYRVSSRKQDAKSEPPPHAAREAEMVSEAVVDAVVAKSWIERLRVFLEQVRSRGESQLEIGSSAQSKPKIAASVPHPLRVLLEACGGKVSFSYSIEIEGQKFSGYLDLDVKALKQHKADCKQWAADTWIAEEPEEKAVWLKAIPFAALKNGDYLALDRRAPSDNPPVVYLNHEDSSEMLSPSLGDFLRAWEAVRYVGPEHWVLADYLDSDGQLSGDTDAARELRQML